jgi:hypothetical protein
MDVFCKTYKIYNKVIFATIMFIGGGACIFWSMNIKSNCYLFLDTNTTGIISNIDVLKLSFQYIYNASNIQYENTWLPLHPILNSSKLLITYSSQHPSCSEVINVPGNQYVNTCEPIINKPWTWQLLMSFGVVSMTLSTIFGLIFMQNLRFM